MYDVALDTVMNETEAIYMVNEINNATAEAGIELDGEMALVYSGNDTIVIEGKLFC